MFSKVFHESDIFTNLFINLFELYQLPGCCSRNLWYFHPCLHNLTNVCVLKYTSRNPTLLYLDQNTLGSSQGHRELHIVHCDILLFHLHSDFRLKSPKVLFLPEPNLGNGRLFPWWAFTESRSQPLLPAFCGI